MALIALVALVALAAAGLSVARFSRLTQEPPALAEDRTFASLRTGDVVVTPEGDFLVEGRSEVAEAQSRADLLPRRSGRKRRWLLVPADGAVALPEAAPRTPHLDRAVGAGGEKLDRKSVERCPAREPRGPGWHGDLRTVSPIALSPGSRP